jgi:hypothetical protein
LDAAGPLFTYSSDPFYKIRLSKGDANFVDVIQTSALGILVDNSPPFADAYFIPNVPGSQPGCPFFPTCSHNRVRELFIESIYSSDSFPTSLACNSFTTWNLLKQCKCSFGCNHMGFYASQSSLGVFYLRTNSQSPYSITITNGSSNMFNTSFSSLCFVLFSIFVYF